MANEDLLKLKIDKSKVVFRPKKEEKGHLRNIGGDLNHPVGLALRQRGLHALYPGSGGYDHAVPPVSSLYDAECKRLCRCPT